jgi:uncharacterized protein
MTRPAGAETIAARLETQDWTAIAAELDERGFALLPAILSAAECAAIAGLYAARDRFRSRVVMEQHHFGRGEYQYFAYPLPEIVAELRTALYPHLAPVANRWHEALGIEAHFPPAHSAYLTHCHRQGQSRPTPLVLKYEAGDYNALHQDLYGDEVFPFQATFLLSDPARDFEGGEFVLVEQRPRMQSRAEVVPLGLGDGVIFAVNHRPVAGKRGAYRVAMRHGVSRIRNGHRLTLGIIFHDAT